jgi:prevent-host-death family protein
MLNTVSITDLKQNTSKIVGEVKSSGQDVTVMQRSRPTVTLIDAQKYQDLIRRLEDFEDIRSIEESKNEPHIPWEKVKQELGL